MPFTAENPAVSDDFSLHYLPASPCLSAAEASDLLYLCFGIFQSMLCTLWGLRNERRLLYNSISECVRDENRAVTGNRNCYVAELRTKFDLGNQPRIPPRNQRIHPPPVWLGWKVKTGICHQHVSQPHWAGMRLPWDSVHWILNPSRLCCCSRKHLFRQECVCGVK